MYPFEEVDKLICIFLLQVSFLSAQACGPVNIAVVQVTKSSSIVLWDKPYQGNSEVCWRYQHNRQCRAVPSPQSYYSLTGLVSNADYEVYVNGYVNGTVCRSDTTRFTTLSGNLIYFQ